MSIVRKTMIAALAFVVDLSSLVRGTGNQIDWSLVGDKYNAGSVYVEVTAAAAADATTVAVVALKKAIKKGTVIQFGADKYATLTSDAAEGAVSLAVEALTTALADGDIGYAPADTGLGKFIPAGTVMVKVAASGKVIPRSGVTSGMGTTYLAWGVLEADAIENSRTAGLTGQSVLFGGIFYENMLPDAIDNGGTLVSGWKTELAATGGSFIWRTAVDNRG